MTQLFVILFILLVQFGTIAQTPHVQSPKSGTKSKKGLAASIVRESALSTLDALIDELPGVDDFRLRVELTETVVKLLAKSHPDRCRKAVDLLFAKAIDLRATRSNDATGQEDPDAAIRSIIQIAAVLDRNLAESYIGRFADEQKAKALDSIPSRNNPQIALAYLRIAAQLVESDPNLALRTATRSLSTGILPDTLVFLARLRKRDVGLANTFFLEALRSCQARGGRDVNELLLLYAFVFSPLRVPIVTPNGIGVLSIPGYIDAAESYPVDMSLGKHYLEASSRLLLDSNRYIPENVGELVSGPTGDFYFLTVIEPMTGEYLGSGAQLIYDQRNILANYLKGEDRAGAFAATERWKSTPMEANVVGRGNGATVEYLVSRAEQTSNPKVREQLYFRAGLAAVNDNQDEKAVELASKLSPDYRDKAQQLLRFSVAVHRVERGQFDEAEQLARRDDLVVRRCYIFTLIADSLLKNKIKYPSRATQLLDEVKQLSQKLTNQKEKLAVLVGAAEVYARLDRARAFELLSEIISSVNKLDGFTGDLSIAHSLKIGGFLFDFSLYDKEFGFFDLLSRLGAGDFYQTLQNTREIQQRAVRIHSVVAVSSGALSAK